MESVQISFIVPVYNREETLSHCVESILNQTYENYEIILVDDGSTDKSNIICDEFEKKDNRVKVIHKDNGGIASTRNVGIKYATGKYICFVDSDDWIEKDLAEYAMSVMDDKDDVFTYGHRMVNDYSVGDQDENKPVYSLRGEEALEKFVENKIRGYTWDKIIKREIFLDNNIAFPEGRNYEDLATTYKILMCAGNVKYTKKVFYNYFIDSTDSITYNDTSKNLKDYYWACMEMYKGIKEYYEAYDVEKIKILECFRINIYTQLYIRLSYYLHAHKNDGNDEIIKIKGEVKEVLDKQSVPIKLLKNYKNFKKYVLYKLGLLDAVIMIRTKKARGYKK